MDIRVICVGDELLSGDTVNTNLAFIGEELAAKGLSIAAEHAVPDDVDDIVYALDCAKQADIVIVVGGLGPTDDDLTRKGVAKFTNRVIFVDPEIRRRVADYLGLRTQGMPSHFLDTQAEHIESATILDNDNGTAPGQVLQSGKTMIALLPGPPREIKPMFIEKLLPLIEEKRDFIWQTLTVRVSGLPESQVEARAKEAIKEIPGLHFAICLKNDCIMVRLGRPDDGDSIPLDKARKNLQDAFGYRLLPEGCLTNAHYLGILLKSHGLQLATAESCTGGGIAAAITDVPGSSDWFVGAVVTYANEWKRDVLGVAPETLERHGAVSEQTVDEMLAGLKSRFHVQAGIAVSGIAGPGGGTPEKPVGTVVIGAFVRDWQAIRTVRFAGNRDTVRLRGANAAINLLIEGLCDNEPRKEATT
ncbi:MAG: CinA family nicotinamide mononucleotide deamidase-related protein [Lentisphaerae bacterium]|jgi:nicotinamide-nucleotide amidase|nr:CinA family nicotinamide mononucleotide deamidase-related protein [Lentisphaerota bacterium]